MYLPHFTTVLIEAFRSSLTAMAKDNEELVAAEVKDKDFDELYDEFKKWSLKGDEGEDDSGDDGDEESDLEDGEREPIVSHKEARRRRKLQQKP
jgi:hypothetical protein